MENPLSTEEQEALYNRLRVAVQEHGAAAYRRKQAMDAFLFSMSAEQRAAILTREIVAGDRHTALQALFVLETEDLKLLFPALVGLTMPYNSGTYAALELIQSLPFQWVMSELESTVLEQYATNQYSEEGDKGTAYMILLNDTETRDHEKALELALWAVTSSDEEIREAGMEFFQKLVKNRSLASSSGGSREQFNAVLAKIPNAPADPQDT